MAKAKTKKKTSRKKSTTKASEVLEYKLDRSGKRLDNIENKIEHLYSISAVLNKNLRKIFSIWDNFFKFIGVAVSLTVAALITLATRSWYYTNGKWDFGVVVGCGLLYIVITALGIGLTCFLVNTLLVKKIQL